MKVLMIIACVTLLAVSMADAQSVVNDPQARPAMKSPGTATVMSIILPGGGQFYNGETGRGLMHLGVAVVGYALFIAYLPGSEWVEDDYYWASYGYYTDEGNAALSYGGLAVALASTVWSVIDAPKGAHRYNNRMGLAALEVEGHWLAFDVDSFDSHGRPAPSFTLSLSF